MTTLENRKIIRLGDFKGETALPSSLVFPKLQVGLPLKRSEVKFRPQQETFSYSGTNKILIKIPNANHLDFRRGYLSFRVVATSTGGTYARIHTGIWSLFDRLYLSQHKEIEDIRRYNLISAELFEGYANPDVASTMGQALFGVDTQANRETYAAGRDYAIPLLSGFLNSTWHPMKFYGETLQLELFLADPVECMEIDGTAPTYTITEVYLHAEKLEFSDAYEQDIQAIIGSGRHFIPFRTFEHYQDTVSTASPHIQINHRTESIDSVISVLRRDDQLRTTTVDDKYITYNKEGMLSWHLRINGHLETEEAIDTSNEAVQAYIQYRKYGNLWNLFGKLREPTSVSGTAYNNDKFLIANDFTAHPGNSFINPRGTSNNTSDIILEFVFSSAPANTQRIDSFVMYPKVVRYDSVGNSSVIY
jgi:hypothetical protein